MIATVGNYEYGYFWYLYQDGTIEYEVELDRRDLQRGAAAGAALPTARWSRRGRAGHATSTSSACGWT